MILYMFKFGWVEVTWLQAGGQKREKFGWDYRREQDPIQYLNEMMGNRVKEYRSNKVNQLQVPTVGTKVGTICLLPITRTVYEASLLVL